MNNIAIVKQRNPAIELYRVMLMFLIVLHHAAYHGHWGHLHGLDAAWPSIYWLFTALTIWHVDGFISITGWFGARFSLVNIAKIWGVMAFYTIPSVIYGFETTHRLKSWFIAGGWFGQTYLFFIFFVPVLNAGIEYLLRGGKYKWGALIVFDIAVALNWFRPYTDITGVVAAQGDAFSLLTFITVYLNVRFLKMSGLSEKITRKMILCSILIFVMISLALKVMINYDSWYNAPHVVLMAIMSLVFFAKFVHVPDPLAKVCVFLSPLMFGVYVLHNTTTFGRFLYQIPQEWLSQKYSLHPLIVIFTSAILCFSACIVVELARRVVFLKIVSHPISKIRNFEEAIHLKEILSGKWD